MPTAPATDAAALSPCSIPTKSSTASGSDSPATSIITSMPHRPAAFPKANRARGKPPRSQPCRSAGSRSRALISHGRAGDHWHGSAQTAGDVRGQRQREILRQRAGPARAAIVRRTTFPIGSSRGATGNTGLMVDDTARDRAIYHALKAADEVAAALQAHLIEEHGADPERAAPQSPSTNSLKLLRQAREHLGVGLRAVQADHIAESDEISLRNR